MKKVKSLKSNNFFKAYITKCQLKFTGNEKQFFDLFQFLLIALSPF